MGFRFGGLFWVLGYPKFGIRVGVSLGLVWSEIRIGFWVLVLKFGVFLGVRFGGLFWVLGYPKFGIRVGVLVDSGVWFRNWVGSD
jgi:hypothetical protein